MTAVVEFGENVRVSLNPTLMGMVFAIAEEMIAEATTVALEKSMLMIVCLLFGLREFELITDVMNQVLGKRDCLMFVY